MLGLGFRGLGCRVDNLEACQVTLGLPMGEL